MSDKTLAQRLEAHAQMHDELAASTGDTEQSGFAADLREAIALLAEHDALRDAEPVAWRISIASEPELGRWFSEDDLKQHGYISEPLYLGRGAA